MAGVSAHGNWSQERIVLALAVVLFAVAAIFLPGFRDIGNLISIVHSVSVLGLLAVGMAIVIIGRGIDLSAVAIMAMSAAWYLQLLNDGWSEWQALGAAGAGVLAIGLVNGFLIAYADVPAIFATLATGSFAARNMGIPVRPMNLLRYVISAFIALAAGLLTAASLHSMNTRIVNSTLLYDIILVVVIGGIGLSGGKGGMRNVIVGAILIGIMQNAMTIIDIPNLYQNLIKATILLIAIVIDSLVNPRDEQTAQQGDI